MRGPLLAVVTLGAVTVGIALLARDRLTRRMAGNPSIASSPDTPAKSSDGASAVKQPSGRPDFSANASVGWPSSTAITSTNELLGCADGEVIVVRGKASIGGGGITDILDLSDMPPLEDTTPVFNLHFADGSFILCSFDDTPRAVWAKWQARNPPGTVVSVRGRYWGGNGRLLGNCTVLPNGFR